MNTYYRPRKPVLLRPVESAQYTSQQFAALAEEFGVRLSVDRTGQCWGNALAESFFATIKRELLGTAAWPSRATARTAILQPRGRHCVDQVVELRLGVEGGRLTAAKSWWTSWATGPGASWSWREKYVLRMFGAAPNQLADWHCCWLRP
ncbi:integrase core domain-containing protein [Streptomyces canus]|uniref:integrase core domain-containing protein n=1 Tax=Streptomyces canus TaxID=58343 RepID=UPI003695FBE8